MDPTSTTTSDDGSTTVQGELPKKPRTKPRKLTMTDKIREARAVNANKVERLHKRADQLRTELANVVRELNDARAEIARADQVLPQAGTLGYGDPNDEQLEGERAPHHHANGVEVSP